MSFDSQGNFRDITGKTAKTDNTSWQNDIPAATEPALPPIKSANNNYVSGESRAETTDTAGKIMLPEKISKNSGKLTPLTPKDSAANGLVIIPGATKRPRIDRLIFRRTKPRSKALNGAFMSVIALLAIVALYASTPSGAPMTISMHSFFASGTLYTPPTPTPRPTATTAAQYNYGGGGSYPNPGAAAIISEINSVFGAYAPGALAVARCESGYDPNAWNPIAILGSHAEGVFQILYPITWYSTSERNNSPYNASANIQAAYQIFSRDGHSWREWECQP